MDEQCSKLIATIKQGRMEPNTPYIIEGDILKRRVEISSKPYLAIVVPKLFIEPVLFQGHNLLGHNGFNCTYATVHRLYYWKGMKASIVKYLRTCHKCQQRNQQVVRFNQGNSEVVSFPTEFISMDLIGEFHPPSKSGHRYAFTVICMLTGYVFCVPLKTKTAIEVVQAYVNNVYAKFGGSLRNLSDNGTEFKNQIIEHVAKELGVKYKKYTPPYCPASNGWIEGLHNFLKSCISKHISSRLEWMAMAPLACAAYNFIPSEHSCESLFFLMFGRDLGLPLNSLLAPSYRYLDNNANMLSLESLQNMYHIAAENLHKAQLRKLPNSAAQLSRTLQEGDLVLRTIRLVPLSQNI